jgi:hypothetical protein
LNGYKLTIRVASAVPGIEVKRDGTPIELAVIGTPVPVDPGVRLIEVTAPQRKPWSTTVNVASGASSTIDVPALAPAVEAFVPEAPRSSSQKTIGLVIGGAGLVAAGVAAVFALSAKSKWDDAQTNHCAGTTVCDGEGVRMVDDAKSSATLATILFGVGGAALVTGAVLWLTAPSHASRAAVRFSPTSVVVQGRF